MSPLTLILIAIGLAVDAFAVAVAVSVTLRTVSPRQVFRLSFHLGLFQALMPVLGWLAGRGLGQFVASWGPWIAFGLLALVGGKAIWEARSKHAWRPAPSDPTRGLSLVVLSVATSIDALVVGVSLAMLDLDIWYPSLVIGCVAAALTTVGMFLGTRLGAHFGQRAEIVGGLILIAIGVKILVQNIT